MSTRQKNSRPELAALLGLPVAWLLPWTVSGAIVFLGYGEVVPDWFDRVSMDWYWAGFVFVPIFGTIISWSSVGSFKRASAVLLGAAISYAALAAFSMIVVITVWTLVDGPFLEGY